MIPLYCINKQRAYEVLPIIDEDDWIRFADWVSKMNFHKYIWRSQDEKMTIEFLIEKGVLY